MSEWKPISRGTLQQSLGKFFLCEHSREKYNEAEDWKCDCWAKAKGPFLGTFLHIVSQAVGRFAARVWLTYLYVLLILEADGVGRQFNIILSITFAYLLGQQYSLLRIACSML